MKRMSLVLAALLFASPVLAVDPDDCRGYRALGALYELRAALMKPHASSYDIGNIIDRRIEEFREPTGQGTYRWVRWVRPDGDAPFQKEGHLAMALHERGDSDAFEASSQHVFAVRVAVPRKRSLLNGNNRVYVGSVHVTYDLNGRVREKVEKIDQWMNPDTSRTIDLEVIADHARASLDASADANHVKESLVELHFEQAVAEDDPANPEYETIRSLGRVRSAYDMDREIDEQIAQLEQTMFSSSRPLPILQIVKDLRRADDLMRSKKEKEVEQGKDLLQDTLRRLH